MKGTFNVKVKSQDEHGSDNKWSEPLSITITINSPPDEPSITYNKVDDELIIIGTDPDENQIRYGISWNNNGNVDKWTSFYNLSVEARISCKGRKGLVGIIAEDEHGE